MQRRFRPPRQGPTPVGQRNRASTIPAKRFEGPTADEWLDDDEDEDYGEDHELRK